MEKEEYYLVKKETLLRLISDSLALECLDADGVDNWSWYMTSRDEMIASYLEKSVKEVRENNYTFMDVAKEQIKDYRRVVKEESYGK
jgi:hypothetical protein